jgi:hypothetical protein
MAATLMGLAVVVVGTAVVTSTLVAPAAVLALLAGAGATRIMYTEVTQTRWLAARERAEQARSFQAAMDRHHVDQVTYTELMTRRLSARDRAIGELNGTVRLLERRVDEAETRVRREARRANDAQERLAAVLDEVLGTGGLDGDVVDGERGLVSVAGGAAGGAGGAGGAPGAAGGVDLMPDRAELPTVVDLLGWDAKATAARSTAEADSATVA